MVRNHNPVCAKAYRVAGIFRVEDPFDHHRAVPEFADPLQVFPGDGRIEIVRQPADVIFQPGRFTQIRRDISQIVRTAVQANIPGPLRVGHCLPVAAQGGIRAAHAGVGVTVARARCRHIDGKDQRGAACCFGALQRVTHKAAIAQDVQLEPHWALDGGGDLFDRADGHGREGKRNAFGIRRGGRLHFPATGVHAAQANGRKGHRHGERFVKQFCLKAQVRHIFQHALAQSHLRKVFHIAPQGIFGIRPAVDIVEQERGQNALRRGAVVTGC